MLVFEISPLFCAVEYTAHNWIHTLDTKCNAYRKKNHILFSGFHKLCDDVKIQRECVTFLAIYMRWKTKLFAVGEREIRCVCCKKRFKRWWNENIQKGSLFFVQLRWTDILVQKRYMLRRWLSHSCIAFIAWNLTLYTQKTFTFKRIVYNFSWILSYLW